MRLRRFRSAPPKAPVLVRGSSAVGMAIVRRAAASSVGGVVMAASMRATCFMAVSFTKGMVIVSAVILTAASALAVAMGVAVAVAVRAAVTMGGAVAMRIPSLGARARIWRERLRQGAVARAPSSPPVSGSAR